GTAAHPVVVFASVNSEAEYVIADVSADSISAPGSVRVREEADGVSVVVPEGGSFSVSGTAGEVRVVSLSWAEAEHAQLVGAGDTRALLTSPDHFTVVGDEAVLWRLRPLGE